MELAVCRDQLNIGNILCFERLERKRQMIEESCRQRAEESKLLKPVTKDPMAATNELFSGRVRMAGGAIASPTLIEIRRPQSCGELRYFETTAQSARGQRTCRPESGN